MRSRSSIKWIAFTLFVIYSWTLFYYTVFGLYKSGTEYFCLQRREDSTDYTFKLLGANSINFERVLSGKKLLTENGYFKNTKDKNTVIKYSINSNHFVMNCSINDPSIFYDSIKLNYMIDWDGYIQFDPYSKSILKNHTISCKFEHKPETCSLRKSDSDKFYLCYLISIGFIFIFSLVILVDYKDCLLQRKIKDFLKLMEDPLSFLDFCNPVTREACYVKKGQVIMCISKLGPPLNIGVGSKSFEDKENKYYIDDKGVHINCKKGGHDYLELDETMIIQLRSYFGLLKMNRENCIIDESRKHFYKTTEVLHMLKRGNNLIFSKAENDFYCLKVDRLNIEMLSNFVKLTKEFKAYLIEHNQRFFGEVNMVALVKSLENKVSHVEKPNGINNSQWKLYTSDIRHIFKDKFRMNKYSQTFWGKSKVLRYMPTEELIEIENNWIKTDESGVEKIEFEVKTSNKVTNLKDVESTMNYCMNDLFYYEGEEKNVYYEWSNGLEDCKNIWKNKTKAIQKEYEEIKNPIRDIPKVDTLIKSYCEMVKKEILPKFAVKYEEEKNRSKERFENYMKIKSSFFKKELGAAYRDMGRKERAVEVISKEVKEFRSGSMLAIINKDFSAVKNKVEKIAENHIKLSNYYDLLKDLSNPEDEKFEMKKISVKLDDVKSNWYKKPNSVDYQTKSRHSKIRKSKKRLNLKGKNLLTNKRSFLAKDCVDLFKKTSEVLLKKDYSPLYELSVKKKPYYSTIKVIKKCLGKQKTSNTKEYDVNKIISIYTSLNFNLLNTKNEDILSLLNEIYSMFQNSIVTNYL